MIDTHAHLTDKAFEGEEKQIIDRARECGVDFIITSGFNLPSSIEAINLAEKYENVYASAGIYPENSPEFDENCKKMLDKLAKNKKVVAIGEIGLQYTEGCPNKKLQQEVFAQQIKLAYENSLPIVIHCREAYGDTLKVLQENKEFLKLGGTLHCYSGSKEMAREFLKLGLHISVGGVSTFKNAEALRCVLEEIPLDRILLETDCPYLTPHPYRGKRNEPAFIPTIVQNLALLKGVTIEDVIKTTDSNARRLFKI